MLNNEAIITKVEAAILKTTELIAKEGVAKNGGIYYEKEDSKLTEEFHWWGQAEAVVGFFNAWQISKNENYLQLSLNSWEFIQNNIIDRKNGEWFWGVDNNSNILDVDKINEWKAPYHNSRMCFEMIGRIDSLIE